jgi:hypothetical protein
MYSHLQTISDERNSEGIRNYHRTYILHVLHIHTHTLSPPPPLSLLYLSLLCLAPYISNKLPGKIYRELFLMERTPTTEDFEFFPPIFPFGLIMVYQLMTIEE